MTNKTMPERIWAWEDHDGFRDFDNMAGWKENGIESDFDGAEYVRADLVSGDASEPLADGQLRWAWYKHHSDGSKEWEVVKIIIEWDGDIKVATAVDIDSTELPAEEYEIGPVICPPENY